ncbi:MAG: hypothetical protein E5V67_13365 [Mesorhizobium sp.]|uniref:hypothetical protein n=1 Tax=unclassified Mesorhizobium TaxID=325217 RepID=UPI000FDA8C88|nr:MULTISPECIES: hypothetical protein [unclassified Mesorhizobium]TGV89964.1 hypothetical protein EN801_019985 [Mesorhizobium sp. M00.F.Ca.ET.158.01.1.1]RWE22965.1 MAG: hypothetical protein EOS41_23215 [Mesorhizobium sp.]TGQ19076.1 hypothetical protein EN860_021660 [Mesorhizobium sp. M00.F.Ca.ET.217.01.1.1]TIT89134.1 MAG: hypothetical protein E5W41_02635 [Mesorhizobium sp.]TIW22713.1 MAG: hypothetical protein E5V65_03260 [Mesorhizobium sp.]
MARTDVERFINELGKKGSPLENLKRRAGGLASIVEFAKDFDYNITLEEVKGFIRSNSQEKPNRNKSCATAGRKGDSSVSTLISLVHTNALANCAPCTSMSPVKVGGKTAVVAVVIVVVIVVAVAS